MSGCEDITVGNNWTKHLLYCKPGSGTHVLLARWLQINSSTNWAKTETDILSFLTGGSSSYHALKGWNAADGGERRDIIIEVTKEMSLIREIFWEQKQCLMVSAWKLTTIIYFSAVSGSGRTNITSFMLLLPSFCHAQNRKFWSFFGHGAK